MNTHKNWTFTFVFALLGSIAYCIPSGIYIHKATYRQTWLLYLGVFMFLIVAIIYTLINSNRRRTNVKTFRLIIDSHVITIISILMSCVILFILMCIFIPGYLSGGHVQNVLPGNQPGVLYDQTKGFSLKVFMTTIFGCFSAGSFVGIVIPFYSSKQAGDASPEAALLKQ